MKKRLIILEGPAGSGKSTQIRKFQDWNPDMAVFLERAKDTEGVRAFENEYMPLTLDTGYILSALYNPARVFLVDRFWVSSLIYQAFRHVSPGVYAPTHPSQVLTSRDLIAMVSLVGTLVKSSQVRDWVLPKVDELTLSFHFVLPSLDIIRENRERSGKYYPFGPTMERACYLNMIKYWWSPDFPPVRLEMTEHFVYHRDQYWEITTSIENEIAGLEA